MSVPTYQVGAHFEALNEPFLMTASKTFEEGFFPFRFPVPDYGREKDRFEIEIRNRKL